jgi:PAS domain S-box-containing protein
METASSYKELEQKNEDLRMLTHIIEVVHKSSSLEEVYKVALDSIVELANIDIAMIYLVDEQRGEVVLQSHRNLPEDYLIRASRIPYPIGATWKVIHTGRVVNIEDAQKDPNIGLAGRHLGYRSLLGIPISLEEKVIGVIWFIGYKEHKFNEREVSLLSSLGNQFGIAIAKAQMIEEIKRSEEALRQSEERYRTLFEQSPVGVYIFNSQFLITQCNERMVQILQSSYHKIIGVDLRRLKDHSFIPAMEKVFQGESSQQEYFYEATTSSAKLWLSLSVSPLYNADAKVIGGMAVVEDITERKRLEEELLKAQKLESLGVLAGGIAHDFNNLLTAILGNISLTKIITDPKDKKIHKRLSEAEKACFRAKDLTQQLLTFSKGGAPVKQVTSIKELIKDSASFAVSGSDVRCEFHIPEDLWMVEIDEGQINQAMANLLINAEQAMLEGGVIRVSAENVNVGLGDGLPLKEGRYVKMEIQDEGIGIREEQLSKVFDPYFTTKQSGSGLGLAAVYSIIRSHNGYIGVESELGVGTRFYIYLPQAQKEISAKVDIKERPVGGKGRILVMDDEDMIREIAGEMLSQIGYKVEFAGDGREAVELYKEAEESGKSFDVVLMDLTIPGGMGGKEAIKRLLEIDPEVKAIVSSGYSNDPIMSNYRQHGFRDVVSKPYSMEDLAETIHRVLNME